MRKEIRMLRIACAVLAGLTAVMSVWAIISNIQIGKLKDEIEALSAGPAAQMQAQTGAYDPDMPAAEFKGGVITVAEAAAEYALLVPYYEMLGMNEAEFAEDAKLDVLDMLIEGKVLEGKAREAGVYELDAAALAELEARVQAEYEETVEYYMAFRFDESKSEAQVREEVVAYLNENGDSYERMLEQAKAEAWRDRLFDHVTSSLEIGDEELREFYQEQLESAEAVYTASYAEYESDCAAGRDVLWHPEGVRRVQMLVIPFDFGQSARYSDIQAMLAAGDASRLQELDALYGELEAEAQAVLSEIRGGRDFMSLLEEYGDDSEGICISGQSTIFGDDIRDAAMALESIGDVSGAVPCDDGLCILRYAGDVTPGPVAYEAVSEELRANYTEELKRSRYNAQVVQWLNEAEPLYYTERF